MTKLLPDANLSGLSQRVHGHLFTAEAQAQPLARALSALEWVTLWPQRQALLGGE